jgi:hypothetical protein
MCDAAVEVVASRCHDDGPFNSPNDVVMAADGAVWFTDPIYGLLEKDKFCDQFIPGEYPSYLELKAKRRTQGCKGVYRASPDGVLTLATAALYRPNGLFPKILSKMACHYERAPLPSNPLLRRIITPLPPLSKHDAWLCLVLQSWHCGRLGSGVKRSV